MCAAFSIEWVLIAIRKLFLFESKVLIHQNNNYSLNECGCVIYEMRLVDASQLWPV